MTELTQKSLEIIKQHFTVSNTYKDYDLQVIIKLKYYYTTISINSMGFVCFKRLYNYYTEDINLFMKCYRNLDEIYEFILNRAINPVRTNNIIRVNKLKFEFNWTSINFNDGHFDSLDDIQKIIDAYPDLFHSADIKIALKD
jgi:hypothetical protein